MVKANQPWTLSVDYPNRHWRAAAIRDGYRSPISLGLLECGTLSKGHLEAMQALKDRALSKPIPKITGVAKGVTPVTVKAKTVTQTKGGRGLKIHASKAAKQKAFRDRKKANG